MPMQHSFPDPNLFSQPDCGREPCVSKGRERHALYDLEYLPPVYPDPPQDDLPSLGGHSSFMSAVAHHTAAPRYSSPKTMPARTAPEPPTRAFRTIPKSRHFGKPIVDEVDLDTDRYAPHKCTAQGFPVNNKVKKAKYATSIDDRGYLTVYEFQLNDQTIMWDYTTGFVHLTGIWKALGNSKADIVRLVENHPELEGVIKRIRGGFLKIQGTWVPYDLCRKLALRTCFTIRHALISVFGPAFPDECLRPGAKGYGTLTLDDTGIDKRRKKRKAVPSVPQGDFAIGNSAPELLREKRPRLAQMSRSATASSSPSLSSSASPERELDEIEEDTTEKTSPPTLPRIVDLDHNGYYPSKTDLLDLLRASRSLQKLSAGSTEQWTEEGGCFNIAGGSTTFVWDGSDALEVLEPETYTTMDRSNGWDSPPRLSRKYSTATQESSLADCPITPPQPYPVPDMSMRVVPHYEMASYHVPTKVHATPYFRTAGIHILSNDVW